MSGEAKHPLRALMLIHNLNIGGAQVAVLNLSRELCDMNCAPLVVSWRHGNNHDVRSSRRTRRHSDWELHAVPSAAQGVHALPLRRRARRTGRQDSA